MVSRATSVLLKERGRDLSVLSRAGLDTGVHEYIVGTPIHGLVALCSYDRVTHSCALVRTAFVH